MLTEIRLNHILYFGDYRKIELTNNAKLIDLIIHTLKTNTLNKQHITNATVVNYLLRNKNLSAETLLSLKELCTNNTQRDLYYSNPILPRSVVLEFLDTIPAVLDPAASQIDTTDITPILNNPTYTSDFEVNERILNKGRDYRLRIAYHSHNKFFLNVLKHDPDPAVRAAITHRPLNFAIWA